MYNASGAGGSSWDISKGDEVRMTNQEVNKMNKDYMHINIDIDGLCLTISDKNCSGVTYQVPDMSPENICKCLMDYFDIYKKN